MSNSATDVYIETGQKRVFAGAVDWPGWCRSGPDENKALQTLFDYSNRYSRVLKNTGLSFHPPAELSAFNITEHLKGNSTTDFGAPDIPPSVDSSQVNESDLARFQLILKACWDAFSETVRKATGKPLRQGPRGGGRSLEGIVEHVFGGEAAYFSRLGLKPDFNKVPDVYENIDQLRQAGQEALARAVHVGVPERGPRGGTRWTARYFVRRSAWHILDHAWEIEDRIL